MRFCTVNSLRRSSFRPPKRCCRRIRRGRPQHVELGLPLPQRTTPQVHWPGEGRHFLGPEMSSSRSRTTTEAPPATHSPPGGQPARPLVPLARFRTRVGLNSLQKGAGQGAWRQQPPPVPPEDLFHPVASLSPVPPRPIDRLHPVTVRARRSTSPPCPREEAPDVEPPPAFAD